MHIAVDIDGTIGYRNERCFIQVCNEDLKLGMDPERLSTLSYEEFLCQPELAAYQEKVGEKYFKLAVGWVDFHRQVLLSALPMAGAVEGVAKLALLAPLAYYTARYTTESEERSQIMAGATHQCLREQQFPQAEEVIFCNGLKDKLLRIAAYIEAEAQEIMLIDDQYERVITSMTAFDQPMRDILLRQMILVAFKAREVPCECHGLRVLPLSSWRHIDTLIGTFSSFSPKRRFSMVAFTDGQLRGTLQHYAGDDPPKPEPKPSEPWPGLPDTPPLPSIPETPPIKK